VYKSLRSVMGAGIKSDPVDTGNVRVAQVSYYWQSWIVHSGVSH